MNTKRNTKTLRCRACAAPLTVDENAASCACGECVLAGKKAGNRAVWLTETAEEQV